VLANFALEEAIISQFSSTIKKHWSWQTEDGGILATKLIWSINGEGSEVAARLRVLADRVLRFLTLAISEALSSPVLKQTSLKFDLTASDSVM
jgi:hypothetical protein